MIVECDEKENGEERPGMVVVTYRARDVGSLERRKYMGCMTSHILARAFVAKSRLLSCLVSSTTNSPLACLPYYVKSAAFYIRIFQSAARTLGATSLDYAIDRVLRVRCVALETDIALQHCSRC